MQSSVVPFSKTFELKNSIINPQIRKIFPKQKAQSINVSPNVMSAISFPSFVREITCYDVMASSTERMEKVYERVTAFLQKVREDSAIL